MLSDFGINSDVRHAHNNMEYSRVKLNFLMKVTAIHIHEIELKIGASKIANMRDMNIRKIAQHTCSWA